jgi:hypothetical protein
MLAHEDGDVLGGADDPVQVDRDSADEDVPTLACSRARTTSRKRAKSIAPE